MAPRYATTTQRGLGQAHVKDKERLLAAHRDGEPCWRCGQPMYKSQGLDRDHVIDRAIGGITGPAVLAHASCNRAAGARNGNQRQPRAIAVAQAPPATCKTCGQTYRRAARMCEMCGAHYHPTYGEQRTCSRPCGLELKRRNGSIGGPRLPRPACERCGKPCQLRHRFCGQACAWAAQSETRQVWPSSPLHHYTCRYCGKPGVTGGSGSAHKREVCTARECQLTRLMENNLVARKGMTREQANAAVMAYRAEGDHRGQWHSSRAW